MAHRKHVNAMSMNAMVWKRVQCPACDLYYYYYFHYHETVSKFHYNAAAALWSLFGMNMAKIELLTNYHMIEE